MSLRLDFIFDLDKVGNVRPIKPIVQRLRTVQERLQFVCTGDTFRQANHATVSPRQVFVLVYLVRTNMVCWLTTNYTRVSGVVPITHDAWFDAAGHGCEHKRRRWQVRE